jgi:hypothetical protein
MIKGTFKDHLVSWIIDFIKASHGAQEASAIIDDIDRRSVYIAVSLFN